MAKYPEIESIDEFQVVLELEAVIEMDPPLPPELVLLLKQVHMAIDIAQRDSSRWFRMACEMKVCLDDLTEAYEDVVSDTKREILDHIEKTVEPLLIGIDSDPLRVAKALSEKIGPI